MSTVQGILLLGTLGTRSLFAYQAEGPWGNDAGGRSRALLAMLHCLFLVDV